MKTILKSDGLKATGFLAPTIVLFSVFFYYPIVKSGYLSLHLTNFRGEAKKYNGLKNYSDLFHSPDFMNSLLLSMEFVGITVCSGLVLSFLLALLLDKPIKGISFFRTVAFSPVSMSVATASTIGLLLFNPSISLLNRMLGFVGVHNLQWLTIPSLAMAAISLVTVWLNLGLNTIILLGAMQSVPEDLYESARLDGAGYWKTVWNITVPMVSPSLFFVFVVSIIGAFQTFGQVNILTSGGPNNGTNLLVYAIYRDAFFNNKYGYASAESMVLFAIILILTLIQFLVVERKVFYK